MSWTYLVLAGVFEIGFTFMLKLSDNFTRLWPVLGFLAFSMASFFFLTMAMKKIPLGTAYAVWTGIGAAGTAVVGCVVFEDPVTLWRSFFLATLVGSIIGLKVVS
jgi:quaternary ammonium compound-resistance protein SugE